MPNVVDISAGKGRSERPGKTALVLTGGGFTGAVYQIGALRALDLLGVNHTVNDFDIYVGTSCGSFVGSLMANGCRPDDLMALLDGQEVPGYDPLNLSRLLRPDYGELASLGVRMPFRISMILKDMAMNMHRLSLVDMITMLAELAPGGFYSLREMTAMMHEQLSRPGLTDDFRQLSSELYIVATDLDTCEPVVFGEQGWDNVAISTAAAASSALPPVYKGVKIRGREFVDGGLRAFANVETAIAHGAKFVLIVNPLVPFDNDRLTPWSGARPRRVSEGGLTDVLGQTFRCLVWSAMHERLDHWRAVHPDVDFVLIEPRRDDALMFGTQIMNVSQRVRIAAHGFESVTVQLSSEFEHYRELCAKHGIRISRRRVIEALQGNAEAPSGTTRWRRILERSSVAAR